MAALIDPKHGFLSETTTVIKIQSLYINHNNRSLNSMIALCVCWRCEMWRLRGLQLREKGVVHQDSDALLPNFPTLKQAGIQNQSLSESPQSTCIHPVPLLMLPGEIVHQADSFSGAIGQDCGVIAEISQVHNTVIRPLDENIFFFDICTHGIGSKTSASR